MPINPKKAESVVGQGALPVKRKTVPRKEIPEEVVNYLKTMSSSPDSLEATLSSIEPEQLIRLREAVERIRLGPKAAIISICSTECTCREQCPLAIAGIAPDGKGCPIERDLFIKSVTQYKEAVLKRVKEYETIEDLENDRPIMTIIFELAEFEILDWRSSGHIAVNGIIEQVPALATKEDIFYRQDVTVSMRAKESLQRRRDSNLRQLLATPEMVAKTRGRGTDGSKSHFDRMQEASSKVREIIAGTIPPTIEINPDTSSERRG